MFLFHAILAFLVFFGQKKLVEQHDLLGWQGLNTTVQSVKTKKTQFFPKTSKHFYKIERRKRPFRGLCFFALLAVDGGTLSVVIKLKSYRSTAGLGSIRKHRLYNNIFRDII